MLSTQPPALTRTDPRFIGTVAFRCEVLDRLNEPQGMTVRAVDDSTCRTVREPRTRVWSLSIETTLLRCLGDESQCWCSCKLPVRVTKLEAFLKTAHPTRFRDLAIESLCVGGWRAQGTEVTFDQGRVALNRSLPRGSEVSIYFRIVGEKHNGHD